MKVMLLIDIQTLIEQVLKKQELGHDYNWRCGRIFSRL